MRDELPSLAGEPWLQSQEQEELANTGHVVILDIIPIKFDSHKQAEIRHEHEHGHVRSRMRSKWPNTCDDMYTAIDKAV